VNLVVDSSVMLSGLLPDEQSPYALSVLEMLERGEAHGIVPHLFQTEVSNGLLMCHRRQRLKQEDLQALLELLVSMPLHKADLPSLTETALYAQKHNLSFYDATYLHLAVMQKAKLATLDNALRNAAESEGVCF